MSFGRVTRTVETTRSVDRSKTRTSPSTPSRGDERIVGAEGRAPCTAIAPDTLEMSRPVEGSHTFSVPSSPVVASLEPSELNATSLTSPSCPWNERTLSPVSPSLMSIDARVLRAFGHEDSRGAPREESSHPGHLQLES